MTKEETIEILKALNMMLHSPDGEPISDVCEAVDMAVEALQDDWVPVSERLPEVGRSVLISDGVWTAEGCYRADGRWHQFRWDCQKEDVIAWRPLPEPYVESEE